MIRYSFSPAIRKSLHAVYIRRSLQMQCLLFLLDWLTASDFDGIAEKVKLTRQ